MSAGAKSPYSLYNQEFVTFEEDHVYNQADAEGFINLFGLPLKVRALLQEKAGKKLWQSSSGAYVSPRPPTR